MTGLPKNIFTRLWDGMRCYQKRFNDKDVNIVMKMRFTCATNSLLRLFYDTNPTFDYPGTWLEEVATPYLFFKASGMEVAIASTKGGELFFCIIVPSKLSTRLKAPSDEIRLIDADPGMF